MPGILRPVNRESHIKFSSVQFSSRRGIYALGKAQMRFTPSLRSFPNLALETVPIVLV